MLFTFASCAENDTPEMEVPVTFMASLQDIESRAADSFGNGEFVNTLLCAVYERIEDEKGEFRYEYMMDGGSTKNQDGTFTYTPMLVKDKTYKVVFWAMNNTDGVPAYQVSEDLTKIIIPTTFNCNQKKLDAFTGQSDDVTVGASLSIKHVSLKRPFALLNFSTKSTDLAEAKTKYSIQDDSSIEASVTVLMESIATEYNAWTDEITSTESEGTYSFGDASILDMQETLDGDSYNRLTSCYVWPVEDKKAKCTIHLKSGETSINTVEVKNVPLTVNYITNIYGELLMGASEYDVTVEDPQTGTTTGDTDTE